MAVYTNSYALISNNSNTYIIDDLKYLVNRLRDANNK